MKTSIKTLGLIVLLLNVVYMSSCEKEPECKKCSAEQEVMQNGTVTATQSISAIEYCGDDLKAIEANPVIETNQTVGTIVQTSRTTYTCN